MKGQRMRRQHRKAIQRRIKRQRRVCFSHGDRFSGSRKGYQRG